MKKEKKDIEDFSFTIEDDKTLEQKEKVIEYSTDILREDILTVINTVSKDVETRAERKKIILEEIDKKFNKDNQAVKDLILEKLRLLVEDLEQQGKLTMNDLFNFYKFISQNEANEKKDLYYYYNLLKDEDNNTLEHFSNMISPKGGNSAVVIAFDKENKKDEIKDLSNSLDSETLKKLDQLYKLMNNN